MTRASFPANRNLWHNPFVLFLPLLVLYAGIILKTTHGLDLQNLLPRHGDEIRYIDYAKNLLRGTYAFDGNYRLWNAPGYPIFLMPFVLLKLPYIFITLCNALLKYLSVVFLYKSVRHYSSRKISIIIALIWGFYFLSFIELPSICTEPLAEFLISFLGFCLIKAFRFRSGKYIWLSGISLGFLILTKAIFSYVLLSALLLYGIGFLLSRFLRGYEKRNVVKALSILSIAFLFVFPYTIYTYRLTGKIYYFADSGGMQLYWMSTPFKNEYGEWHNANLTRKKNNLCNDSLLVANHRQDMDYVNQFTGFDRDDAYKKLAIDNIKNHPLKYIRNCFANSGRLLFTFPDSYQPQDDRDLLNVYINSFFWVGMIAASLLSLLNFRRLHFEMNLIAILIFSYFGFSVLVSGMLRFFYVMIPLMLVWMAYVFSRTVEIKWRLPKKEEG
jgi:hypothetical protein